MTNDTTIHQNNSITFVREVTARYSGPRRRAGPMNSPVPAASFARDVLPDNVREHVVALYLDGSNKVAAYSIVSTGTANQAVLHPREVFQPAVLCGAVSLILIHNHPSGNLEASQSDLQVTKQIAEAGDILGIKLLDHLIVTDDEHYSFNDAGKL